MRPSTIEAVSTDSRREEVSMRAWVVARSALVSVAIAAGCGGAGHPEATGVDAGASTREAGARDGSAADSGASSGDGGSGSGQSDGGSSQGDSGSSQGDGGSNGGSPDSGPDSDGGSGTEGDGGATGACPAAPPANMSACAPGDGTCDYEEYHVFCVCGSDLVWTCNVIAG
jgi:hypothetical protein